MALFIDELEWLRQREWWMLHVNGAPATRWNVEMVARANEGCADEVLGPGGSQIIESPHDVDVGKVNQPIAAKNEIGFGESLLDEVEAEKTSTWRREALCAEHD
jgi:hypothetical protein